MVLLCYTYPSIRYTNPLLLGCIYFKWAFMSVFLCDICFGVFMNSDFGKQSSVFKKASCGELQRDVCAVHMTAICLEELLSTWMWQVWLRNLTCITLNVMQILKEIDGYHIEKPNTRKFIIISLFGSLQLLSDWGRDS